MARARDWHEVRKDALDAGVITEPGVAAARHRHDEQVRAYKLRQVRQSQSARQADVAEAMHVSQSRVSRIERGDLDHIEMATLRAYVQAIGGQLRVQAEFDDGSLTLT